MRIFFIIAAFFLIPAAAFAQENAETETDTAAVHKSEESKSDSGSAGGGVKNNSSDFNKKKLSLDHYDDKKWYAFIAYSFFNADKNYASMFNYRLGIGAGYRFNKYFGLELSFLYGDGKDNGVIVNGNLQNWRGSVYDIAAMGTAQYPFTLSVGSIAPYVALGASYSFGNMKADIYIGEEKHQRKYDTSSGAIQMKAGFRYYYKVLIAGAFVGYSLNFMKMGEIDDFSGVSYGAELGIKF